MKIKTARAASFSMNLVWHEGLADPHQLADRALFASGSNAAAVLDPVEEPLDQISITVVAWAEADWISPIASRRDVRPAST